MNQYKIFALKSLRKLYFTLFNRQVNSRPNCVVDPDVASQIIFELLSGEKPCMIARFGSTELATLVNYVGVMENDNSWYRFIIGKSNEWWWNKKIILQMQNWSGFFPAEIKAIEQYSQLFLDDSKYIDVLGSWLDNEDLILDDSNVKKVHLRLLEPFWNAIPWTSILANKNVLVVHPFKSDILNQYQNNRDLLFSNPHVLPTFKSIYVIEAVQSLGAADNRFNSWFEALNFMKAEIDAIDYDIALIGCGAYGLHLAAHVKRKGKKAVHMGGALQLLFGIRGKRWEDPNYGVKEWGIPYGSYSNLMNEYWIRPSQENKPKDAQLVEGACYW